MDQSRRYEHLKMLVKRPPRCIIRRILFAFNKVHMEMEDSKGFVFYNCDVTYRRAYGIPAFQYRFQNRMIVPFQRYAIHSHSNMVNMACVFCHRVCICLVSRCLFALQATNPVRRVQVISTPVQPQSIFST